jgi:hypothetical protein
MLGLETIFVGTHDVTHGKVAALRNLDYRKKYELSYREDLKKYGQELTLDRANKKLLVRRITRPLVLRLWRDACSGAPRMKLSGTEASLMKFVEQLPRKPLPKEELLKLNRYLLDPEDVDVDTTIENPFELGDIGEILYAEKQPTVRLWIHFKEYVVGGVPDGVAESYVYEFKSTMQTGRRVERVKEMALRQALIYSYAFKRPNVKVQVAQFHLSKNMLPIKVKDLPKPDIATISKPASEDEALTILRDFDQAFHAGKHED